MPKIVTPLTTTKIAAAKPGASVIKLSDGGGLALWIMPNGRKIWRIQYRRPVDSKFDTLTLGAYPEFSLARAREWREQVRADLAAKADPKQAAKHRAAEQASEDAFSFRRVSKDWWDRWKDEVTDDYADQVWRVLEQNVFPRMGDRPIGKITTREVVEVLTPMEARGALEYLKRARQKVTEIFTFAIARGIIDNNVAAGIGGAFKKHDGQHFRALSPDQLPLLGKILDSRMITRQTKQMVMWQLLTLTRPVEAASTRWSHIDGDQWLIPAERMKRGRDHLIPLSRQAQVVLDVMRPLSSHRPYVFPHRNTPSTDHANEGSANVALKRAGVPTTAHGLRALASTVLHEAGFDSMVIEKALSHVDDNKTRAAYNRAEYLSHRQELLQWWADYVEEKLRTTGN